MIIGATQKFTLYADLIMDRFRKLDNETNEKTISKLETELKRFCYDFDQIVDELDSLNRLNSENPNYNWRTSRNIRTVNLINSLRNKEYTLGQLAEIGATPYVNTDGINILKYMNESLDYMKAVFKNFYDEANYLFIAETNRHSYESERINEYSKKVKFYYDRYKDSEQMNQIFNYGSTEIEAILKKIAPSRNYNILFYNAIYNLNLAKSIHGISNAKKYAATCCIPDNDFRKYFENICIGTNESWKIHLYGFDFCVARWSMINFNFYHPDLDLTTKERREDMQIKKMYRTLRQNGILFLVIPRYAISYNFIDTASEYFISRGEFELEDDMVLLVLQRYDKSLFTAYNSESENDIVDRLLNLKNTITKYSGQDIEIDNLFSGYNGEIKTFIGGELDIDAIRDAFNGSNIELLKQINLNNKKRNNNKILLPFNKSQISQILVSGKLDGKIIEDDKCVHIIRGSTYKTSHTKNIEVTEGSKSYEVKRVYTSNTVQITALSPTGTIRKFSDI